jgi:isopenicillin-N epimerase
VFDEYQRRQRELERQPVEFLARHYERLMDEAKARLAAYLGAGPEDLVFAPNATAGLNVVARSLPLRPGDEVIVTNHEYGGVELLWRHVCGRTGATFVPRPLGPGPALVDELWGAVTARTRVISVSHITSPTALRLPVEEVCRRARRDGVLSVVDGAHAPGQIEVDLSAIDADFYAGNCHNRRYIYLRKSVVR